MVPFAAMLARLVHISDLHIGGYSLVGSPQGRSKGLRPHDPFAISDLGSALATLTGSEETRLVVTGDMTTTGDEPEFTLWHTLLHQGWTFGRRPNPFGDVKALAPRFSGVHVVPGNHDYWGGISGLFRTRFDILAAHLGASPVRFTPVELPGYRVHLYGLDTQSGLPPGLTWRQFEARGELDQEELAQLADFIASDRRLARDDGFQFRAVVLLHHSLYFRKAGPFWHLARKLRAVALEMNEGSRVRLEACVRDAGIDVLLSGHTHVPAIYHPENGTLCLEITSGATTQQTEAGDYGQSQAFVVHDLAVVDKRLSWTPRLMVRPVDGEPGAHAFKECRGAIPDGDFHGLERFGTTFWL